MNLLKLRALVALAACLAAPTVVGQELVEKVAVRNRLYTLDNRSELGLDVGLTMLARLTDHYNLSAHYAYNFSNAFALEARAGYALSKHTGLANQIAENFAADTKVKTGEDLSDLWQMGANGAVGLRWAPIYGKLSLMGELAVHFQLYAWLGVGAAQLHRESLVYCLARSGATCQSFFTEDRVSVIGTGALGLRFFLADHHAIKVEVRDYSYPDRYLENIVLADALANRPTGDPARNPGLTNLVQLDMGYSFVF